MIFIGPDNHQFRATSFRAVAIHFSEEGLELATIVDKENFEILEYLK